LRAATAQALVLVFLLSYIVIVTPALLDDHAALVDHEIEDCLDLCMKRAFPISD
jgi:hypothetical protein